MSHSVPKVLVVDDSKEITDLIFSYCLHYDREFTTIVTNRPEHVLGILQQNDDIRLIVTDFRMPVIDGLELIIKVKEHYPGVYFIMMTGYGSPRLREQVEARGIVRYLEKPFKINELVDLIRQTMARTARGFDGFVPALQLADIIQLVALSSGDAALEITADDHIGKVYFRSGNIIHAECEGRKGSEAFYELFGWKSGRFVVSHLLPDVPETITESWQGLILEAARREDEAKLSEGGIGSPVIQPQTTAASESPEVTLNLPSEDNVTDAGKGSNDLVSPPVAEKVEDETIIQDSHKIAESALRLVPGLRFLDEIKRRQTPAPAQSVAKGDAGLAFLEETVPVCVNYYRGLVPNTGKPVPIRMTKIGELTPVLRRHLMFHLHMVSTSSFRFEDTPFNFSDPRVAKAAFEFLEKLLETWEITPDQLTAMLEGAVRFHLAMALAPATALAEFLTDNGEGRGVRMHAILTAMLSRSVVEQVYRPLAEHLTRNRTHIYQPADLQPVIQDVLLKADAGALNEELHNSVVVILEIGSVGRDITPQTLQREVASLMLGSRGRKDWVEKLERMLPDREAAVSWETIKNLA